MADVKKWSVTYTKHIKQKRKVYQDGFLELHKSTNKLLLFDDGEKLLEYRILKKDEGVRCGETLTFNAFLVDVNGSAEGDHEEPPRSSNSLRRDNRTADRNKSQRLTLSPSQKIIRVSEFKKREILKYEAIQSKSPDTTKSSVTGSESLYIVFQAESEWEVLYTTQLTKKAKTYHDGFLQLLIRGSIGRQIMLLDDNRNTLDGRFLKKDEKIESGVKLALDGHLVNIVEPCGDNTSCGEHNSNVKREKGIMHGQQSWTYRENTLQKESIKNEFQNDRASHRSQDTAEPSETEWQVLYTTQVTKKSKTYHDGFLKLAICGAHGRQAALYDETRKLLNTRLLKKEEVLRTGVSLAFADYLIDIGEPEGKNETTTELTAHQGNNCNIVKEIGKMHKQQNSLTSNNNSLRGKTHTNAWLRKDAESKFNISYMSTKEASREEPTKKPLRDVYQILSFLQKPRMENNSMVAGYTDRKMTPMKGPPVSNAADLDCPEDDQPPKTSAPRDQSSENVDGMESRENIDLNRPSDIMSSTAISTGSGNRLAKDIDNGSSHEEFYTENTEVDKRCGGANASNMPRSTTTYSCDPVGDQKNPSEKLTHVSEMDEYPSFDLGF